MMWNLIKILPVQLVLISIEDKNSKAQVFVSEWASVFISPPAESQQSHREKSLIMGHIFIIPLAVIIILWCM